MTISSGYIFCACLSTAIGLAAFQMLWLSIGRMGQAREIDQSAKKLLAIVGAALLIVLTLFWFYAWRQWPY